MEDVDNVGERVDSGKHGASGAQTDLDFSSCRDSLKSTTGYDNIVISAICQGDKLDPGAWDCLSCVNMCFMLGRLRDLLIRMFRIDMLRPHSLRFSISSFILVLRRRRHEISSS